MLSNLVCGLVNEPGKAVIGLAEASIDYIVVVKFGGVGTFEIAAWFCKLAMSARWSTKSR